MPIERDRGRLAFACDACGDRVTGDAGYVHISMNRVGAVEQAVAAWETEHSPPPTGDPVKDLMGRMLDRDDLMAYPSPARWRVHHESCDPEPEVGPYKISVSRIDTWPKLVHWTAHLMEKNWLQHTDWSDILRKIGEDA